MSPLSLGLVPCAREDDDPLIFLPITQIVRYEVEENLMADEDDSTTSHNLIAITLRLHEERAWRLYTGTEEMCVNTLTRLLERSRDEGRT